MSSKPSFRPTDDEIWAYVTDAHTGIMTTLRRDGMPIAMPLWFAVVDRAIYVHTRGKKLLRLEHFTGTAEPVDLPDDLLARVDAENARKYDAFRTPAEDMPAATAQHDGSTMRWVRFTPDARVLSWGNAKLTGGR